MYQGSLGKLKNVCKTALADTTNSEYALLMKYSTRRFTVDTSNKMFIAEASDLDAVTAGKITLVSDLLNEATFECEIIDHDDEGDVLCWIYHPTPESLAATPRLEGWSVHILND